VLTLRIWFTAAQKAGLWERWKNGQSAAAISRALERKNKTGVERIVVLHGGIVRLLDGVCRARVLTSSVEARAIQGRPDMTYSSQRAFHLAEPGRHPSPRMMEAFVNIGPSSANAQLREQTKSGHKLSHS
jgi:hypothetical protein